ncbi:MAG: hypothetical protein M0T79_07485 [Actinomycetota bacterium]|jgi:hypothetical protein|nr:hypothetical protein [Actinomycetota bacterium]
MPTTCARDRVLALTDPGGEGHVHQAFLSDESAEPVKGEDLAGRD